MMRSSKNFLLLIVIIFSSAFLKADKNAPKSVKDLNFKLYSGDLIPMVGLGTWQITDPETIRNVVDWALEAGYRHIDTAQIYENEEAIGDALKEFMPKYNLSRGDIFITSKIHPGVVNKDAYQSVKESLEKLQLEYIDLYLIHTPAAFFTKFLVNPTDLLRIEVSEGEQNRKARDHKWQGLVKAKGEGLVRNIGVSNYGVKHLKELLANDHGVRPAVNQIFWNPNNHPQDILDFCRKENIFIVAYSSLGSTGDGQKLQDDPRVKKIAKKLGKSPAQVLLRWALQDDIAIIPKTTSKKYIKENIELDFTIPDEDVQILNTFEQKHAIFDVQTID